MAKDGYYVRLRNFIGSKLFFYIILAIFLVSAIWLVITARYPMAFDENYHYGIIKVYSNQISPFISQAPEHTESLGDITRYPSYLFHYLMSFPYRLISLFTNSDQVKIIFLRLINVGMFLVGILYFRKLLLLSRAGKALTNLVLFFFIMIPNVIFLAAHINYDNLLVPLTAMVLLYCLQFILLAQKGRFDANLFIKITGLNVLTTLVVFTYLPIAFAAQAAVIAAAIFYAHKKRKSLVAGLTTSFKSESSFLKWVWVLVLIIGIGLFLERYGINQVKYDNLIPHCGQILPADSCVQYGPWGRDFKLMQKTPSTWSSARYFMQWAGQNMYEFFFTINYNYVNKPPLPLPFIAAWTVTIGGTILAVFNWRRIKENTAFVFFTFVIVVFSVSLWINNLNRFRTVGFPVAIHGRYWMQLLPIILLLLALGIKYTIERLPMNLRARVATVVLGLVFVCFLQGGGISSYILISDQSWYWPDAATTSINNATNSVFNKTIIH